MYDAPYGPTRPFWNGRVCLHKYTPANCPGLVAGWEIDEFVHHDGEINLSLWRVEAYLRDKPEHDERYALTYSCGRYADAYVPKNHTSEDYQAALDELVWKCRQISGRVFEDEEKWRGRYGALYSKRGNK